MTGALTCAKVLDMNEYGNSRSKFNALLNEQIRHEFTSSHQYVAIAVYYDDLDLPQLAKFFYRQALEERNHALAATKYLIDRDVHVELGGVQAVKSDFENFMEPIELLLANEKEVTEQWDRLFRTAKDEHDSLGEQFTHWFLKEQVEEVSTATTLLRIAKRAKDNWFDVEEWVARELSDPKTSDDHPPVAGGLL
ncbi:Ferritin Dps family protein [Segniliparus rotundus DSM 44985]|uniref:Ferritin n=2 Tax=Segniliparus rotundus TaxID=286802 RepID=D6ZDY5_SEGRD|nr:Ferritin Dps family protein [Segniliparus rotundus DSM 44985]